MTNTLFLLIKTSSSPPSGGFFIWENDMDDMEQTSDMALSKDSYVIEIKVEAGKPIKVCVEPMSEDYADEKEGKDYQEVGSIIEALSLAKDIYTNGAGDLKREEEQDAFSQVKPMQMEGMMNG